MAKTRLSLSFPRVSRRYGRSRADEDGDCRSVLSRVVLAFGVIALGASVLPAGAQLATLVEDLTPTVNSVEVSYSDFHPVGGRAVFTVSRRGFNHVYSTDGTPGGTIELAVPEKFRLRLKGALLYAEDSELWRTDGTPAGSWRLASPELSDYSGIGNQAAAQLDDGTILVLSRAGLVVSDGQPDSARIVDVTLRASPSGVVAAGTSAFVVASGAGVALFDGTGSEIVFKTGRQIPWYLVSEERLFFLTETQGHYELWVADAESRTAVLVKKLGTRDFLPAIVAATDDGVILSLGPRLQQQFFLTDGEQLIQISEVAGGSAGEAIVPFEGEYLFTGFDSDGFRYLWRSGATLAEQVRVAELCRSCREPRFERLGDLELLQFKDSSLFSTNGTSIGTVLLADGARDLSVLGDRAQYVTGFGLAETDGTLSGTRRIAAGDELRIRRAGSHRGRSSAPLPQGAVFVAEKLGGEAGVWATDGSPSSARLIVEDPPRSGNSSFDELVAGDGVAYFVRDSSGDVFAADSDGARLVFKSSTVGCGSRDLLGVFEGKGLFDCVDDDGSTIWAVDAQGGREELSATTDPFYSGSPLRAAGGLMFERGNRLFGSDGTDSGTSVIFSAPDQLRPRILGGNTAHGYFGVSAGQGQNIYRTDLTQTGTERVAFVPFVRADASAVTEAGVVYLIADFELWRVDPQTSAASRLQGPAVRSSVFLQALGDRVIYSGLSSQGPSMIATDGTTFTRLGPVANCSVEPVVAGDRLFFFASEAPAHQDAACVLWSSDGDGIGESFGAPLGSSSLGSVELVTLGDSVFFTADSRDFGREIWTSDGTPSGTGLAHDLWPGRVSSLPHTLVPGGDTLYFMADDGLAGQELFRIDAGAPACTETEGTVCLNQSRFRVDTTWVDFQDNRGVGRAEAITDDTAYFWFFDSANVEVVVKVLDGTSINGNFWVFSGALSDVFYTVTVSDSQTGLSRRYLNPRGNFGSFGDTAALSDRAGSGVIEIAAAPSTHVTTASTQAAACVPESQTVCLNGDRFQVEVDWKTTQGTSGQGNAVQLTEDTGYFWFFDADNVELVLKVLDATGVNGKYWVFYGSLSDVEYEMRVTDTLTGQVRTYRNENGTFASVGDTEAF